jgi:4a-hydroxytetrahydrobiopterin dehydratase
VDAALGQLEWQREGDRLVKTVKKKDFGEAMAFVNALADVAEEANHHPDIEIHWNTVVLGLWTHTAGGITQKDLDLAARIDQLER